MEFFKLLLDIAVYMFENWAYILELAFDHLLMVFLGITFALVIGVPLGIVCAKNSRIAPIILSLVNIIQIIPSLAMLSILMLYFGLGFKTVVVGLFFYSLLPITRNTYVGLIEVDKHISEAGRGIGMTTLQLLLKIQIPLALPYMMAGIRVAAVIAIGVASIAPFIGGDGLGREIISGINSRNDIRIYAGAIPAAMLAIIADLSLGRLERRLKSKTA